MKAFVWVAAASILLVMMPAQASTPLACTDPCEVESHSFGYRMPVVEVENGTNVLFTSIDIGHLTVEQNTVSSDPSCFAADANPTTPPPPVRFSIQDGSVVATTNPETEDASSAECLNARELFDGAYVVPFVCVFHPVLMKGALVVTE